MARRKNSNKKDKYIKILEKASVVVGAVAFTLGVARKMINYKKGK